MQCGISFFGIPLNCAALMRRCEEDLVRHSREKCQTIALTHPFRTIFLSSYLLWEEPNSDDDNDDIFCT